MKEYSKKKKKKLKEAYQKASKRLYNNNEAGDTGMEFLIEELRERKMLIEDTENNNVNHPKHYALGGIETIDYIKAKMTADEFKGFLKGNVFKYLSRESQKNGVEDLKKSLWYLNYLVDLMDWKNKKTR